MRTLLLVAALVAVPAVAQATDCSSEPVWSGGDSTALGEFVKKKRDYCTDCLHGTVRNDGSGNEWCEGGQSGASNGGLPFGTNAIDAAVQQASTGRVDPQVANLAAAQLGLNVGAAFFGMLDQAAAKAKAKQEAERRAAAEAEMRRIAEENRKREETWQRLRGELRLETQDSLSPQLETEGTLQLKTDATFDGDRGDYMWKQDTGTRELREKDRNGDFFDACQENYGAPAGQWTPPFSDARDLARGAALIRQAWSSGPRNPIYAPGDAREAVVDEAMLVAGGCHQKTTIPTDSIALPSNAVTVLRDESVARKLATDNRIAAAADADQARARRDLVAALLDQAKQDPASQKKSIDALLKLLRIRDQEKTAADAKLDLAIRAEAAAANRQRSTYVAVSLRSNGGGGPVAYCAEEQATIDRMRKGLGTFENNINRTQRAETGSRAAAAKATEDAKRALIEAAVEEAKSQLESYTMAMAKAGQIAGWREARAGAPTDALTTNRREIADLLSQLMLQKEKLPSKKDIEDGVKSGSEFGRDLAASSNSIRATVLLLNQKLDEAGLLKEAGGALVESYFPAYALAFRVLDALTRVGTALVDASMNDADAETARLNAEGYRQEYRRLTGILDDRAARLKDVRSHGGCLVRPQ